MPQHEKIEDCAEKGDDHHGDADGRDMKTFGEIPGCGGEDYRANADGKTDSVKCDEVLQTLWMKARKKLEPLSQRKRDGGDVRGSSSGTN